MIIFHIRKERSRLFCIDVLSMLVGSAAFDFLSFHRLFLISHFNQVIVWRLMDTESKSQERTEKCKTQINSRTLAAGIAYNVKNWNWKCPINQHLMINARMQRYPSLRGCFRSVFNTFPKSRRSSRGLKRFTNLSLNSSPCVKSCESSFGGLSLPRWQLVVGSSGVHLTQYWRWRNCEPVAQQAATILRDLLPRRQECMLGIFTMKYAHTRIILSFFFFYTHQRPSKINDSRKILCWTSKYQEMCCHVLPSWNARRVWIIAFPHCSCR